MVKNVIKVYARVKPEKNRKDLLNYRVLRRPKENVEEDVFLLVAPNPRSKEYPDNRPESWNFSFFRILDEFATQESVFENVARPVMESALDGYNGTIMAYGQTASGKTYTVTGRQDAERRGIIPRSLQYMFDAIRKRSENVYSVEVAYLEIYNETGYDLLDRRQERDVALTRSEDLPRIALMADEAGRLHTKNLSFHLVTNLEEAFELLLLGDGNRIVSETPMNPRSSRSHCIFTIVVSAKQFGANRYNRAKVHLVDLAGSERVYKCAISGTTLTEAKYINLSMHYLEQVIVSLGQENASHIPYRNSLLTSILRDSFGGNCLTTMLVTLNVSSVNVEETLSTCRFAQRVALIKNDAKLNLDTDIQSENALLRAENERLRQQLKTLSNRSTPDDLTAEDKVYLDSRIRIFLETSEQISWDHDPKKVQYCFESIKRSFELSRDPKSCTKKLEYYKNLVIQRDKEISHLIDTLKKVKNHKSIVAIDDTMGNIQDGKQERIENCVPPKKQKRRSKTRKPMIQGRIEDHDGTTADSDKTFCHNVEELESNVVTKSQSTKGSTGPAVTSGSISTDTRKPSLSCCSTVNLTLNDSMNDKLGETNRRSSRTLGRKQKIVETKDSVRSYSKVESLDEKDVNVAVTKTSLEELNYPVPVYRRLLNFSAKPEDKSGAVKEDAKTGKGDSVRGSNSNDTCKHFDDLPLTGDPEIDEEIIAFYKAKRSGCAY